MKKRIFSIFCVLCLVLTMLPATAWAVAGDVTYLYYDTNTKTWQTGTTSSGEYTPTDLCYGTALGSAGTETWYVVNGISDSIGSAISVCGDVHLILSAGSNISLVNSSLNITDDSSLTIYGQDSSSGSLSVTPYSSSPITLGSGSSLTIHSGKLILQTGFATGISVGSGTLTIYGGSVSTNTRSNPGISVSSGGTLNIYGGTLTSQGIYGSTGSITGGAGSSININGNAVITGNISGADNGNNWNAIINNTVYGTVTLPDSLKTNLSKYLTVPNGAELILPNGTSIPSSGTITVESGGTLTVEDGSTVYNNNTITVNEGGTFSGGGTIVNQSNGTITGDTNGVTIRYEPTVTVTSQSNKDTNVADKNEKNVIFTATVSDRVGTPTGSVQFKKDDTNLGDPVTLNDGTATCTVSASDLGLGDHSITAVYTPAGGSSYTGKTGALTFRVVGDVTGITVTSQPTKTEYKTGDKLDLTGLEITVSYEGSETYKPVLSWGAEGITASPDNGTALQASEHNGKAVTITYGGKTAETATLAVYETPEQTDGVYQIETAGELFWFAALVNGTLEGVAQNTAANAVLTADIDLGGSKWTPIAPSATFKSNATSVAETTDKSYSGTFDGQGHTISNFEIRTNSAEKTGGLFGTVTGTIQNLGIVNASFDNGGDYDGRFGALCGLLVADDDIETAATIQNCYVVGSSIAATGKIAGAVCGANYGGTIKDCYECGNTVTAHDRIGHLVGDNQNDYNNPNAQWLTLRGTVTNCYSDTKLVGDQGGEVNSGGVKDAEEFASGEVAYLLNGSSSDSLVWYQNLDNGQTVDSYPVLDSSHGIVYCIEEDPVRYSNDPDATTEPKDITEAAVTLSPESFTYTGTEQKPTVTVKLGDKTLTEGTHYTVTYSGDGINVGSYSVTVAGDGTYYTGTATSKPSYTISPATPTLTWDGESQALVYTGSQAAVTAPTVTLVNGETYSGEISYQYKASGESAYTDGLPTDVGTYTVVASIAAQGNYTAASGEMTLTIQKADAVVDSAPSAVDGLTYTGKAQALVTAGKATGGTMQYSLSETGTYSTDIPTSTNVGSYTVWYKVVGDENHNDTTAQSVTATIAKAAAKVTKAPAANTLTYNGEAQALATAGEADGGTLVYSLEKDGDYDAAIPTGTNAGSYSIWYKVVGDANHSDTDPVQVEVTIKKADPDVTAPDGLTATYGDTLSDVALSGGWTWDTPDASVGNVGGNTFSAIYTPSDTTNYNTVNEDLTVTVSAKDITGAEITLGDSLTYTGQEQTQQIASVTVDGLAVTYTVTGNTATDAGDYTLTISGTGNFTGTATKGWSIAKANYTGTTGVSSTVLANWPDKVTLPDIPAGASYGTPSTTDDLTGLSIEGGVLHYTGGESITEGQEYKITVPVNGGTNYNDYQITVTLTGSDKQTLTITGVTAQNGTYNGQTQAGYAGTPAAVGYTGDFTVTYNTEDGKAPTNAGTYSVTIAIPDTDPQYVGSIVLEFTIAKKALTVSAPSASVYVGDNAPLLALTYTGLVDGESVTPSEAPAFTITKSDDTEIALEDAVKTAGTYTITWSNADQGFTGDENYDIQTETAGTLTVSTRSSGGGSSSNITTETTKNPDGSTTITVTNKVTGTVTETTKFPDGSKEVVETTKDGTVTTTTTDTAGNKTQVVENTDGSSQTTVTNKDGSGSVTVVDENGNVVSSATLSQSAVEAAQEKGEAVTLPMPEVPVTADRETAPTVTVSLPSGTTAKVEIPVEDVTPGTVAVLVKSNGDEEIIKTSVTTGNGVAVTLNDGDTVKTVDNSKTFADVPDNYWGAEAVDFAVSRELFAGTSATTFAPNTAMTRAMIVTVLARFEGVDTTTGSTWYEAGQQWAMQNGISDGSNMEQGLTREQLATMLWRYAGSPSVSNDLSNYTDAGTVSSYAQQAMAWCVEQGIIGGTTATTLSPQGPATRAQVATILMRFIEGMA